MKREEGTFYKGRSHISRYLCHKFELINVKKRPQFAAIKGVARVWQRRSFSQLKVVKSDISFRIMYVIAESLNGEEAISLARTISHLLYHK